MSDKQVQSPQISPEIPLADAVPSDAASSRHPLTPAAQRALAEAEARRLAAEKENIHKAPKEIQGPAGLEPTRYGDWENKGIASDF